MSREINNVIVIGASGNVGQLIVSSLIAADFTVSALTRSSSPATFPPHVSVHKTDYSLTSLLDAFEGKDAIVSAIATSSTGQQKAIIDAAVEVDVKRFLPSEYAVDTSRLEIPKFLPPAIPKQDIVNYLKTKEKEGMSWTVLCVGAWFD
jgi:putative NADH-flavin reductase